MAFGQRDGKQDPDGLLAPAPNELAERVRELRETVRAQQLRLNQLEEAQSRSLNGARGPRNVSPAEHRYIIEELDELRGILNRLEMRLDEHEEGMRWLLERLTELREAMRPTPASEPRASDDTSRTPAG